MQAVALLMACGAFCSTSGKLFHNSAVTVLRPSDHHLNSEFGFSMAYQKYQNSDSARLVVGAPREGLFGKVYTCPLSDKSKDNIDCSTIDMSSLPKIKSDSKQGNSNPNFLFGSSVTAASDYLLACAPYLPKDVKYKIKRNSRRGYYFDSARTPYKHIYGSCFLQNSNTSIFSEIVDNGVKLNDRFSRKHKLTTETTLENPSNIARGGLGLNTLADTDNGYLLVTKSAYPTDILYVDIANPLAVSKSLVEDYSETYSGFRDGYFNLGFGMTFGTFFDPSVTLYAISVCFSDLDMKSSILFLKEIPTTRKFEIFNDPGKNGIQHLPFYIENEDVGFMYGYALSAAYINKDGLSELLVGAPAHSDEEAIEFGALHIYVGHVLPRINKDRMRTIYGSKERGRFGSAIATSDIDGDKIPEIFVSAPYEDSEDSGVGTVYMLSGDELNRVLIVGSKYKEMKLSSLRRTQKLRGTSASKQYGFSLQIVKDIDDNGCDELAVGSPESSTVELIRCLPAVNTSISLELLGTEIVQEKASQFLVKVCLSVTLSPKCHAITGSILVTSSVIGNAKIIKPTFIYKMTKKQKDEYCENVIVDLPPKKTAKGKYTFTAKLSVYNDDDREGKVYKPWVVLGAQSQTENQLVVRRHCDGVECQPALTYDLIWTGRKFIDAQTSALKETLLLTVNNTGHETNEAQVRLTVQGSQISALTSQCYKENGNVYLCSLRTLERDSSITIPVILNTTEIDNVLALNIMAKLQDGGFKQLHYDPIYQNIPCKLDPASVILKGSKHHLNVTDEDMEKSKIITISDDHEFYITNNGFVTWHLTAVLEIKKEPYINNIKILATDVCQQSNDEGKFKFSCRLSPGGVAKIIASIEISKGAIGSKIINENIQIISELSIDLLPTDKSLKAKALTHLQYKKILTVGNNRNMVIMIVVIVAIILLLVLALVLGKYGFFKRTRKQQLLVLQESVRKQSVRLASESSKSHKPSAADGPHCDIEVVDDCVFSDVDITQSSQTTKDDVVLVKDMVT